MTTNNIDLLVRTYGGKLSPEGMGEYPHNDKVHEYRSVWDNNDQADRFCNFFPPGGIEHDRTVIDEVLVMFFTINYL